MDSRVLASKSANLPDETASMCKATTVQKSAPKECQMYKSKPKASCSAKRKRAEASEDSRKRLRKMADYDTSFVPFVEGDRIVMGPNGSSIEKVHLDRIKWGLTSGAVRTVLRSVFERDVLASHSLSGNPSPGKL